MKKYTLLPLLCAMLFSIQTNYSQTYESNAAGYWELQPQFIDNGAYLDIYFNSKFEDRASEGGDDIYDVLKNIEIQWNGTVIYALEHTSLSNINYGSSYTTSTYTENRFDDDEFRESILTEITSSLTLQYLNETAYGGTQDVVQHHIQIEKSKIAAMQTSNLTSEFHIYATYYDRSTTNSEDNAGHHTSITYTINKFNYETNGSILEVIGSASGRDLLDPEFVVNGDSMEFSYNLESWNGSGAYYYEFDQIAKLKMEWNGVIIYAVENTPTYVNPYNLGTEMEKTNPNFANFTSSADYIESTRNELTSYITTNSVYSSVAAFEKVRTTVYIYLPGLQDMEFSTLTDNLKITTEYRDNFNSANSYSTENSGFHQSPNFTIYASEEDNDGDDETNFSAVINPTTGTVDLRFRIEKRLGEANYDHISCIDFHVENLTSNVDTKIARIGHDNLSCSHTLPITNSFTTTGGDPFTISYLSNTNIIIGGQDANGDQYITVQYYYDPSVNPDDLRCYINGTYRVRDFYESNDVPVYWASNQDIITPNTVYTMPAVTGLTVTPSATNCEIDLSWITPPSFGDAILNRVSIYRDGNIITSYAPGLSTYTDNNIVAGQEYSYQAVSEYVRDFGNLRLQGNPTPGIVGTISTPSAPSALTLTQGACGTDITVDWTYAVNPTNFEIQRKSSTTGFVTINNTIGGSLRNYIDNNNIVSGEVYSYKIAAIGGVCSSVGQFSDVVAITGDTLDITVVLAESGLQTSKGYFDDRTELFWTTTGNNDQYLDRFKIYAREVGSLALPTLLATVPEADRSWQHYTGDAGTTYEYFIIGERVVSTPCGNIVSASYDIASLTGFQTNLGLPSVKVGVAYAVGFRYPTGIINGNITYAGGVAVPNVKVVAEKYSGSNGNSLYFNGTSSYAVVPNSTSISTDTAFTISMWVKPQSLGSSVMLQKNGTYGIEFNGSTNQPFIFVKDATGTTHTLSGAANTMQIGTWVNLTMSYSKSDGVMKLYINGVQTGGTNTVPSGDRDLQLTASDLYIGCQYNGTFGFHYQGFLDEVKIYNRRLTDEEVLRASGVVSATDASGLVAYWKMFVGVGDHIYDAAHIGSFYHKNDGEIHGATWSTDIPSSTQLGFAGYTDANGNYSINGVGYVGTGENFNVIPTATLSGSVHEFDPSARTLFIGQGSAIHNGIDFTDISSFEFSGNVNFLFNDVANINFQSSGSEGVQLYLNGQGALTGGGQIPVQTDDQGFFSVDIPIGEYFIEFRKSGHSFIDGGRFPASGTWDFQEDLAGVQIWDTTTHILTGLVAGGTNEAAKDLGFNKTINNIGKAKFTITSTDGKIIRNIVTDSLTGEYSINLPPKQYTLSDVEWVANSVDIIPSGNISTLDLATITSYNGTTVTDSIFDVGGTLLSVNSNYYNVRKDFIHRESPQLVVTTYPEEFYQSSSDTLVNIDLTTLPFETYNSRQFYSFDFDAVEIYTNVDNNTKDTSVVTDGTLQVNNGFGTRITSSDNQTILPSVIPLDSGYLNYFFIVTEPNVTAVTSLGLEHLSYTKQMSATLTVGSFSTSWPNPAVPTETHRVYIMGSKPKGSSFITKSPDVVDFILRDPPGSDSYSFLDQTNTITRVEDWSVGGEINGYARIEAGAAANPNVGFLGCAGEEVNVQVNAFAEINTSFKASGGNEFSTEISLNTVFETSDAPELVGAASDVFVANSHNMQTGVADYVIPIKLSDCAGNCAGDIFHATNGTQYRMGTFERSYISPVNGATKVLYTQNHIENVLIPDLIGLRNSILLTNSLYTSNLPTSDPMYGSNNDDLGWGGSATTTNFIRTEPGDFNGNSYTFNAPNPVNLAVDSVRWFNQQIRLWTEALADNEIEKMLAINNTPSFDKENISMSSGVTLSNTKTQSSSLNKNFNFEISASYTVGAHASFSGGGVHLLAEASLEVGINATYAITDGVTNEISTGYVLSDGDQDDFISVDVYPGKGNNGAVFSIFGGQTSCPHEAAAEMRFATAEYVQRKIDNLNNEKTLLLTTITAQDEIINSGAASTNAKTKAQQSKANYQLKILNLPDVTQLQAIKTQLSGSTPVLLGNSTLQRDKPTLLINGAETAQVFNVPASQNANFLLLLQNESESGDGMDYAIELLDGTNPNGLELKVDGQTIVNPLSFVVPGGGAIQKAMTVTRGAFEYDYDSVGVVIHSTCQYDPNGGDEIIADTVYFSVSFIPVCSEIEIISPDDQWVMNNSFNNEMLVTVGGYDVNMQDFEKIKVQYKPSNSSSWTLLETYYRDSTIAGWAGEPTLPQNGNIFTYTWNLGLLPDGNYDIRSVATCALAETESVIHSGVVDRLNIQPFGTPLPADGILSFGEDVSIQFNEQVNAGLLSAANIDVRGVTNAGAIRHDASVYFGGNISNTIEIQQVNLANKSFTLEFYAKRDVDGVMQSILSHGTDAPTDLNIYFNTSDQMVFDLGAQQVVGVSSTDNNWHHYSVSYNDATHDGQIFVDGVSDGINNAFDNGYSQNENLFIGYSKADNANPLTGNVHEVRLWTKELTAGEVNIASVQRMVGNEAGLLYNWELEEARGSVANDKVRGKHGTMNATWSVIPLGYGLRLNGNVDQATITSPNYNGDADYTVEFWFKSDGGADEVLLSTGTGESNDSNTSSWAMGINAGGNFYAVSNDEMLTSLNFVNDGLWHHAAIVTTARGNAVLYVDANEEQTVTNDSLNGFSGASLAIGQRAWFTGSVYNTDKQFTGNMDELRIWKTARTLDQIDRDRFNKLTGDEPGLDEYYSFEDVNQFGAVANTNNQSQSGTAASTSITLGTGTVTDQVTPTIKLERPVVPINFTYVVNNDKIIITPTASDASIENIQLDFTVSNVQDLNGNTIESPVTWTAFVDRNQVVWQDQIFYFDTVKGSNITFTSNVLNNSGQSSTFDITNIPSWMQVSPTSGTVGPLSTAPITFTIPSTVNSGMYQQDMHLTTSFGYPEILDVNLKVRETPPADWTVDATQFQYSMNIIGQIAINSLISRNDEDILAVFVNGDCRGVATLQYLSSYDNYQAFLSIYSDSTTTSGETLDFRIWESATGDIHPIVSHSLPSSDFVFNAFYGSGSTPELFNANNDVSGTIAIPQGWKWISFNLQGSDLDSTDIILNNLVSNDNDIIKTRVNIADGSGGFTQLPQFDTYSSTVGWAGSITQNGGANTSVLYKIQSSNAGTILYQGEIVSPELDTINLVQGWNYLGYVGNVNISLTDGLANYTASTGDVIKSQYQSAIYDAGFGWIGNLNTLEPNVGYMIQTNIAQSFTYPIAATVKSSIEADVEWMLAQSDWNLNYHQFANNMTIVAKIENDTETYTDYHSNKGLVGAFVNSECRGIATAIYNEMDDSYLYFVTINGDYQADEITFKYMDKENGHEYKAFELTTFGSDKTEGSIEIPFILTLEKSMIVKAGDNRVSIYPNPFATETTINISLENDAAVSLILEDIRGRVLDRTNFGTQLKGTTQLKYQNSDLPAGVYFIRLSIGEQSTKEKIIITK